MSAAPFRQTPAQTGARGNETGEGFNNGGGVRLRRYRDRLAALAPSGGGGCHQDMLAVANMGRAAGLSEGEVWHDLRDHAKGDRHISDAEITDRVRTAFQTSFVPTYRPSRPVVVDGNATRYRYVVRGRELTGTANAGCLIDALGKRSPVAIPDDPAASAVSFIRELYRYDEKLFIGERYHGRENVIAAGEWVESIEQAGRVLFPHFAINPLTGNEGVTKDGKPSFRSDDCVAAFRYALVEFDRVPMDEQLAFWCGFPAPVAALIHSGGKSIHALLKVDCSDREAWTNEVEGVLFGSVLTPIGVDSACRNEARLSRIPGHTRADKDRLQKLLYLNAAPDVEGIFHE